MADRIEPFKARLRLGPRSTEGKDAGGEQPSIDWSETLQLVERASDELRKALKRGDDLASEIREVTQQAQDEISRLGARVAELQDQLDEAEARRSKAEDWLRRVHGALQERFPQAFRDPVHSDEVRAEGQVG